MKVIATLYSAEETRELTSLLEREQIPYEVRTASEESGLESTEVLVGIEHYERATAITDNWDSASDEEAKYKLGIRCPKCHSSDWERVEDAYYVEMEIVGLRCNRCGCVFTRAGLVTG